MPKRATVLPLPHQGPSGDFVLSHPLDEFYRRAGIPLPPLQEIEAEAMPEPYKRLLVHSNDMTSTLEAFHEEHVLIAVLKRERQGDDYFREVVLRTESDNKPVEFGAIKINLVLFPPAAREQVLSERWPLGRILKDCAISYTSWPKAFLKIASDRLISTALDLSGAHVLYGRRNTLLSVEGQPLAEIVEILPPC